VRPGGATRGKWRILDGNVETGLISNSELQGGSPRLCQLRTDRLAPVNKIELCIDAYEIYGDPANIVASTVVELDDTPLYFTGDIRIVWRPPRMPDEVSCGRPALGYDGSDSNL
jgi:hypothetical protein